MRRLLAAVLLLALCAVVAPWPPTAVAATTGGTSADSARGGVADAARSGALAYGAPAPPRPVVRTFRVTPRSLVEGAAPRIRVRIDHPGARRVTARIVVLGAATGRVGARIGLGRVRTGRTVAVRWPRRTRLRAGTYVVRLHAKDADGATLARAANATGKAALVVRPRPRPEKSQPAPQRQPTPAPSRPASPSGGVFPIAGPYSFSGPDGSFGSARPGRAGRPGRSHEGQDIVAAAGVPIVAPVAGTVAFVAFQEGGAGQYVVLTADDGRTLFFAHLQAGSVAVKPGQRVAAAAPLARVGSTGASSGPHLHFEIWLGGWRHQGGRPIDPLPQLQAWAR